MNHENRKPLDADTAKKMADALANSGIVNCEVEAEPNPHFGAYEAFSICHGGHDAKAWRELKEWLDAPSPQYFRKVAEYCHRALRRYDTPDNQRELLAFSWGYFSALVEGGKARSEP